MPLVTRFPTACLLATAALCATAFSSPAAMTPAAHADTGPFVGTGAGPLMPPPVHDEDWIGDHLTITVQYSGTDSDGTYELYCHPSRGSHPDPDGACAVADRDTRWGADTFADVPENTVCTLQYGGPATARITGIWAGRPVDASYDRSNGCEIARWERMVPLLPALRTAPEREAAAWS